MSESTAVTDVELQTQLFIDGEFVDSAEGTTFEVENPADERTLAEVAEAKEADVDRAVQAARRAFQSDEWQRMPARERGRLLWRLADLLEDRIDEVARIETLNKG